MSRFFHSNQRPSCVWFTKCWCVILNDSHSLPGGDVPCRAGRDGDRTDPARQLDWQTGHAAHRGHYPRGERPWGRQQPSRTPGAVEGLQWEHHAQGPAQLQRYTATAAGEGRGGCIWCFPQSCFKRDWNHEIRVLNAPEYRMRWCARPGVYRAVPDLCDLRMPGFWKLSSATVY